MTHQSHPDEPPQEAEHGPEAVHQEHQQGGAAERPRVGDHDHRRVEGQERRGEQDEGTEDGG